MRASPCNRAVSCRACCHAERLTWTAADSPQSPASQRPMAAFQALHTRRIAERWPASCVNRLIPCGRVLRGSSAAVWTETSVLKQHCLELGPKAPAHRGTLAGRVVVHTPGIHHAIVKRHCTLLCSCARHRLTTGWQDVGRALCCYGGLSGPSRRRPSSLCCTCAGTHRQDVVREILPTAGRLAGVPRQLVTGGAVHRSTPKVPRCERVASRGNRNAV